MDQQVHRIAHSTEEPLEQKKVNSVKFADVAQTFNKAQRTYCKLRP